MKIDQFNGDSSVEGVCFVEGEVRFMFTDGETDDTYQVRIPTDRFISQAQAERMSVHVRLECIADYLDIEQKSGRYIIPAGLQKQMKICRDGYYLAIGLRAKEYPLLLQVRGYKLLVACPIQTIDEVKVTPLHAGP